MRSVDLSNAIWRRSTYSNQDGGQCVEVADGLAGAIPVRDSKDPQGPVLIFAPSAWAAFVATVKGGNLLG